MKRVFQTSLSNAPPFTFEAPFRVEIKQDADELRRVCNARHLPRECYYGDILKLKLCFLLYHGDDIALIFWVSLSGEYSRFIKFAEGTAELYYFTTLPKFRGMGLSGKMSCYASHYLRQAGFRRAVVVIHEQNIASIKPIERAGFRYVTSAKSIGPFNLKVRCCAPRPPIDHAHGPGRNA